MNSRRSNNDDDFTAEVTCYVTVKMKDEIAKLARDKGVSVSVVVRWAMTSYLKDQKR